MLTERTAALSPAKLALLQQRLKEKGIKAEPKGIQRSRGVDPAPLSFNQERLWFLNQLEPDGAVYNIPVWLRLEGELNVVVLERCLNEVLRRHEVLRTRFEVLEGRPVSVLDPFLPLEMPTVDLRDLPTSLLREEAMRICKEEAQRPFDLARDVMLRVRLLRVAEAEHILFLNRHHIASDGWSMGVLLRELESLYQAFARNEASPLAELPIQYSDYATWQRDWLQGDVLEKQLGYWRKQLGGAPALLELPTDRSRPAAQSYRGALVSHVLPESLACALGELSRQEGITLFMTLLAAFQVLLHRYTSRDDIPVGSVVAGRNRMEIEGLIGFFANTLVFRGDLSGDPSFREFLRRTRTVCMGAYAHQDLPFDKLVQELQPERDLSHSPIFQVMFVLQNAPAANIDLPGLRVTAPTLIDGGASEFDLSLFVTERDGALQASVEYSTDLFDADTIQRLLNHYQTLLEGITGDPDQRIARLPLLSAAESLELLGDPPFISPHPEQGSCWHELFERQVTRTPDSVAVVFEKQKLTYRELNKRANQLASHLRRLSVGPEVIVGLFLERSLETIVGLLGVFKAGGAYVPLDPAYPRERIAFMLNDTQAPLVLTQRSLITSLPAETTNTLCLDEFDLALGNSDNLPRNGTSSNLAYVIYTSGSSGQPKGVMVEHSALVTYTSVAADYYAITPVDRVLQFASINFDVSVEEICCTLLRGATLLLRTEQMIESVQNFAAKCRKLKLSVLILPTAFWHELVSRLGSEKVELPDSLRLVVIGGESALRERVVEWKTHFPGIRLVNSYGPTEATVGATAWELPPNAVAFANEQVPIGKPLSHTAAYILDPHLQLVPLGVIGELHLAGAALARGYLNRSELTQNKFIANPYRPSERLYKTGDLVRRLPDGNLVFQGRVDEQVKIRGFRVELGEIATHLREHRSVRDAVVIARDDSPGMKRLVAYVVLIEASERVSADLRAFLKERLPSYMLPAAFVTLSALPLTRSGKVDRRALPEPETAELSDDFIAPRDELETALVKIWEKTLRRHSISVSDNFFDVGGHSLLALAIFSEIEKRLGKNLPLSTLFQAPTIEQLAQALRDRGWSPPWSPLVTIKSSGGSSPLFCVHGADGGVLHYRSLGAYLEPQQPFYGLQSPGLDGARVTATTAETFAEDYLAAIREVQPKGPYFLCGYSAGGIIAYEMAQQLQANGEKVALLVLFDTSHPRAARRRNTFHERCAMRRQEIANLSAGRALRYLLRRFGRML
ncbi:MAG: hypothetical protein QOD99_351, partial [Chthoniobacter sp.]|nr:hypothetical protein [Chthoniobacter sp.]